MTARYHRSKIGRLPYAVRNELCERMRDGATGAACLAWLNAHPEMAKVMRQTGCAPVNAQNLSDWRAGGYQDWLNDQKETERLRRYADLSGAIVEATGGDPSAVGSRMLTAKILEAIRTADGNDAEGLARAIASLRRQDIAAKRADLAASKLEQDQQRLDLDQKRFAVQTCELFVKWHADRRVGAIMDDKSADNAAKIDALGRLMFADLWEDGE